MFIELKPSPLGRGDRLRWERLLPLLTSLRSATFPNGEGSRFALLDYRWVSISLRYCMGVLPVTCLNL